MPDAIRRGGFDSGGASIDGGAYTWRNDGFFYGRPGDESPQIFIRGGQSSWNGGGGQPLILVDGIERTMNDIDPGDIESLSVLKDASATAVFGGVKGGANGVILITTKRGGREGKAQLSLTASSAIKRCLEFLKNTILTIVYWLPMKPSKELYQ